MKNLYLSYEKFVTYVTEKGDRLHFRFGQYATDVPDHIKELDALCAKGHPIIYRNEAKLTITPEEEDPVSAYKQKIIEEFLQAQQKAADASTDMGNSVQGQLKTSNTSDIAPVTGGIPAALMSFAKK